MSDSASVPRPPLGNVVLLAGPALDALVAERLGMPGVGYYAPADYPLRRMMASESSLRVDDDHGAKSVMVATEEAALALFEQYWPPSMHPRRVFKKMMREGWGPIS